MPTPLPVIVDVTVQEVIQGVVSIEGTLRFAVDTLTFDYQPRDTRRQVLAEESMPLPLDQLRALELKRRILGATIVLHPKQLITFEYVVGAARHDLVFRVKRRYRKAAARFVARVQRAHAALGEDEVDRIPFTLPSANLGITEIGGLVYLDEAYLVLEVQAGITGGFQKKQQVIQVDPRALDDIRFERGMVRDHLVIRPTKRDLFTVMPGMYKGKETLTLSLKTTYRAAAEQLADEVMRRRKGAAD